MTRLVFEIVIVENALFIALSQLAFKLRFRIRFNEVCSSFITNKVLFDDIKKYLTESISPYDKKKYETCIEAEKMQACSKILLNIV